MRGFGLQGEVFIHSSGVEFFSVLVNKSSDYNPSFNM